MQHSETITNLAAALVSAQAEIGKAGKNAENPHLKSKYANLAEVWDTCQEVLPKHGLAVMQLPSPASERDMLLLETVLIHSSGEWVSSMIAMPLAKADPQGYGSAMTYARRYGLSAAVGVVPDDDDDGHEASQRSTSNPTPRPAQPAARPATPPAARSSAGGATMKDFFKALEDAGLMEPDPERGEGKSKVAGEYYGIAKKAGLSNSWSKYSAAEYAAAIEAVRAHVARHEESPELPDMEDPFA